MDLDCSFSIKTFRFKDLIEKTVQAETSPHFIFSQAFMWALIMNFLTGVGVNQQPPHPCSHAQPAVAVGAWSAGT